MNNIIIRPMKSSDKKEVFQMMRVFYDSPAVEHKAPDEILRKDIDDCISNLPYIEGFIIEKSENIAGYFMTAMSYTTEYGGICVWLEDLYIKPEYRNSGISGKVFEFIENYYPNAVRFKLEVETENQIAINAYKKRGYKISPYSEMTKEI